MDDKTRFGFRNWDFSEQTLGVPFPSGANEHQASFLKMNMYPNRSSVIPEAEAQGSGIEFGSHVWVHQRNFLSAMKSNPDSLQSTQINTETGLPAIPISMIIPTYGPTQNGEVGTKSSKIRKQSSTKKCNDVASQALRPKQPKKQSDVSTKKKGVSTSTTTQKRNLDFIIDGTTIDFSQAPIPVCSCTGVFRQCYRWGAGGWQSSCCTTSVSEYPLPMSSSRPGARLAGRKMSNGAYGKLLQRLAAEGCDFSEAVDLKDHWAKHGAQPGYLRPSREIWLKHLLAPSAVFKNTHKYHLLQAFHHGFEEEHQGTVKTVARNRRKGSSHRSRCNLGQCSKKR